MLASPKRSAVIYWRITITYVSQSALVPSLGLGEPLEQHPVFHWDHSQAVANFPTKSSRYHQMSPLVMSHPLMQFPTLILV